jgi:two-component system sensor histidine kinase YesM
MLKQKVRYLFLAIITMYLVLFVLINFFYLKENMMNYTLNNNQKTMISIGNNLKSELNTINSMSQLLMTNRDIIAYLKSENSPRSLASHRATTAMYDITNSFDHITSVYLFRLDREYVHIAKGITWVYRNHLESEEWTREIYEKNGGYVIRIDGGGAFRSKSGEPLVSFIRLVNDLDTQKPMAILVINLSVSLLKDSYKNMESPDKLFYYFDENFQHINTGHELPNIEQFKPVDAPYHQVTVGAFGKEQVLSFYRIPDTPFILAGIERMSYIRFIPSESIWIIISLVALTLFSLILIGIFITVYITNPIERLVQSMDKSKTGWLKRVSLPLPDDEIGHLKNSYNNMLVEINKLINELLEKEKKTQQAELNALQEQIKPHFLYNTLDTIAYLALQESSEKVYDAIETLGNFYRRFLSRGSSEIPLREEIHIVKDYLKLQKLRYDDIFDDEYLLDEDVMSIKVPKLILQPLVENSLYHGVRPKGERCVIRITTKKKENWLYISVYDNGIGMNQEKLNTIMLDNNRSFGFKGTIERIQYYYGREDVYEVVSEEGLYTEVTLKIPL